MATSSLINSLKLTASFKTSSPSPSRRVSVVALAQKQEQPVISRRDMSLVALTTLATFASSSPAQAFLGFGDNGEIYTAETGKLIADINAALELDLSDPKREDTMAALRKETVDWVSKYRRDNNFAGRPSFSLLYSAVNALDGQLNSFGMNSKIPGKRLERLQKSLQDAERQLQRGR